MSTKRSVKWEWVDPTKKKKTHSIRCLEILGDDEPCGGILPKQNIEKHYETFHNEGSDKSKWTRPRKRSKRDWEWVDSTKKGTSDQVRCLSKTLNDEPCYKEVKKSDLSNHFNRVHPGEVIKNKLCKPIPYKKKKRGPTTWEWVDPSKTGKQSKARCLIVTGDKECGMKLSYSSLSIHRTKCHKRIPSRNYTRQPNKTLYDETNGKKYNWEFIDAKIRGPKASVRCLEPVGDRPCADIVTLQCYANHFKQVHTQKRKPQNRWKPGDNKIHNWELVEGRPNKYGQTRDRHYIRCLELNGDKICGYECQMTWYNWHYKTSHTSQKERRKFQKKLNFLSSKSRQKDSLADLYRFQSKKKIMNKDPIRFMAVENESDITPEMKELIQNVIDINEMDQKRIRERVEFKPYHGTVILLFKPRENDNPEMNVEEMMAKYENDNSFEIFLFYDTSTQKGPCSAYHACPESKSPVTRMVLEHGYSIFTVHIKFDEGTLEQNFQAAMDWQNFYTVLSQHRKYWGQRDTGIQITIMNAFILQKSNYKSIMLPELAKECLFTAVYGKQIFIPVRNYANIPWTKYKFPKNTSCKKLKTEWYTTKRGIRKPRGINRRFYREFDKQEISSDENTDNEQESDQETNSMSDDSIIYEVDELNETEDSDVEMLFEKPGNSQEMSTASSDEDMSESESDSDDRDLSDLE